MTEFEIIFSLCVFFVAGTAKGLVGIGLPTIAISLMVQVLDPKLAVTLVLMPLLCTNIWQSWQSGNVFRTIKRYAPYWITMCFFIYISSFYAQEFSVQAMLFIMGGTIVLFTLAQLFLHPPKLTDRWRNPGQILAGFLSGMMGGVTAIWGPPILMYLISRRVPKDEFVRATGVLLMLGGVPLVFSYWAQGALVGDRAVMSCILVVPAVIGFVLGEKFRARLDADLFRKAVLWMFLLLGFNILRRAMMGE